MNPLRWPLALQTIAAVLLGAAVGAVAGPRVAFLGLFAKLIITIIKTFATPLLFLAIFDSMVHAQLHGRGFLRMLGISAVNGLCAVAISLALLNGFHPGRYLPNPGGSAKTIATLEWEQAISSLVPESIAGPFAANNIPAVIVIALLLGGAVRVLRRETEGEDAAWLQSLSRGAGLLLRAHLRILYWIVRFSPIAVFGAVAKATGEHGFAVLLGLGAFLAVVLGGMAIQVLIVYQGWIRIIGGLSLRRFWAAARDPLAYSFGVNSSLATLPLTLGALQRLGVSPGAARLSACVGTNFNNDGILLYEVTAMLFLAQAHGLELGLAQQLLMAVVCVLATLGVAGVPEAGIIALSLVLATVGLPIESLPVLLTVDWFIARMRSVVNVASDMTVAVGIDALSPRTANAGGEATPAGER
ncbi:MAG TPA: dicarboxylate/amino acid:cation symporter [Haliangium sp.]|nr:dicarboxylate/amino acid:cation symporter [Haliangium sp.]